MHQRPWHGHGHRDQLDAHVVNYADDFVICCRPGNAEAALTRTQALMARLGLEVNAAKTRVARLPEEAFDFLGYTVGRFYGKDGRAYIGTRPSRKAVKILLGRIHDRTTPQWHRDDPVIRDPVDQCVCYHGVPTGGRAVVPNRSAGSGIRPSRTDRPRRPCGVGSTGSTCSASP